MQLFVYRICLAILSGMLGIECKKDNKVKTSLLCWASAVLWSIVAVLGAIQGM